MKQIAEDVTRIDSTTKENRIRLDTLNASIEGMERDVRVENARSESRIRENSEPES